MIPFCSAKKGKNSQVIIQRFRDGDTVIVAHRCHCAKTWHEVILRIADIESWEPSGDTKKKAKAVVKKLNQMFMGTRGELFLKQKNCDKYGRAVGDIYIRNKLLSSLLVDMRYAWLRDTKTKGNVIYPNMLKL